MPRLSRGRWIGSVLVAVLFNALGLMAMVEINKHFVSRSSSAKAQIEFLQFQEQPKKKKRRRVKQNRIRVKHRQVATPLPDLPSAMSATGLGLSLAGDADLFSDLLGKGARFEGSLILKEDAVDVPPRVISRAPVQYPRRAEEREIEGYVVFKLQVSRDGRVERVWMLESQPPGVFEAAAEKAVRQYRFSPARYQGRTVPVLVRHKMVFKLES